MRKLAECRQVVVAAAAVLVFGARASAQLPDPAQSSASPPTGTGLVAGQVADATSGRPVGGVMVSLTGAVPSQATGLAVNIGLGPSSSPPGAPRQVLTDAEGRFVFHHLAKGRYTIRTTAPGYVAGAFGQNRPNGPPQTIELAADDTRLGNLTVRAWKTGAITGTIVDEAGEPIVGVPVTTMRRTMVNGQPRLMMGGDANTDDRGVYRFASLIPGDYLVVVRSSQTTVPATVLDALAQSFSSGVSLANTEVYRELLSSGTSPFTGGGGFRVGDLVLQSGSYGSGAPAPAPADDGRVVVYPTTVYPSATTLSHGTAITVASGEERSGIDLQLKLMPAVRVSGTVTGPEGPLRNTGVRLFPAGGEMFTGSVPNFETATTATDASGAFTFLGVTTGQYTLKVARIPRPPPTSMPSNMTTIEVMGPGGMTVMGVGMLAPNVPGSMPPAPPPVPTEPTLWAELSISVGDSDLTGLAVVLRPGPRLSGQLQFEGSRSAPTADQLLRANISITPLSPDSSRLRLQPLARVGADGRFTTGGYVPGRYQIGANLPMLPGGVSGWTFKAATLNGRNLTDDPLEVEGEDISGIVITFTDRTTQLSGSVADAQGRPDTTADVIAFPADSQGWRKGVPNPRRIRAARTSTTGKYEFSDLPAGNYYIVAAGGESTGDIQDPATLEALIPAATRITLADGERKTLDLAVRK